MPVTLPVNPYCDSFDFKVVFDLIEGKIKFDISPTQFKDISGFIGVSLDITTPAGVFSPQGYVIDSSNPVQVFYLDIPKMKDVYRWGNYILKATIFLQGNVSGTQTKELFLSPPDCLGDINGMIGTINLTVDCNKGAVIGRGFSGYAYQGVYGVNYRVKEKITMADLAFRQRAHQTGAVFVGGFFHDGPT